MRLLDCLSIYMFYLFSELFRILTFDRSIRRDVLPFLDFLFVLHLYSLLFLNIISELEIFFAVSTEQNLSASSRERETFASVTVLMFETAQFPL